jgi:hypothetical protein
MSLSAGDYLEVLTDDTGGASSSNHWVRLLVMKISDAAAVANGVSAATTVSNATWTSIPVAMEFDDAGFWDVGNPTRLTAPADGLYLLYEYTIFDTADYDGVERSSRLLLNGTTVVARNRTPSYNSGGGQRKGGVACALLELSAGDYLEVQAYHDAGNSLADVATSYFGVFETLGSGCMLTKTADQSIEINVFVPVAFNSELTDSGGYHDNGSNNSRVTVPGGNGGYHLMICDQHMDGLFSSTSMWRKNGSAYLFFTGAAAPEGGMATWANHDGNGAYTSFSFAVADIAAGDYVEQGAAHDDGASRTLLADTTCLVALVGGSG